MAKNPKIKVKLNRKALGKVAEQVIREALESGAVKHSCPECGTEFPIRPGDNPCPSCGFVIHAEFEQPRL